MARLALLLLRRRCCCRLVSVRACCARAVALPLSSWLSRSGRCVARLALAAGCWAVRRSLSLAPLAVGSAAPCWLCCSLSALLALAVAGCLLALAAVPPGTRLGLCGCVAVGAGATRGLAVSSPSIWRCVRPMLCRVGCRVRCRVGAVCCPAGWWRLFVGVCLAACWLGPCRLLVLSRLVGTAVV